MASSDVRIEWKPNMMAKVLRSQGAYAIMQRFGNEVCARANHLAMPKARYGMKVSPGRKRFWKARIYTGNIVAMVDARKRGTLTKVI